MTSAINPSVANGANESTAMSQANLDSIPDSSATNPSDSYYSDFKTTRSNASNDSTYNVSASDVNPSANRNSLKIATASTQQSSQQSVQDGRLSKLGKDDVSGMLKGLNLGVSIATKQRIRSDITSTSDQVDQNIRNGGVNTGTLVSVTVNKGHAWNMYKDTYAGMSAGLGSSTPPTANGNGNYWTWGQPNQKTGYVWVSNTKPENLPSNVSWMTPAQFRNMANAFTI